jgi:hypothetical protein
MEQLTLVQAAEEYSLQKAPVIGELTARNAFKAGAEWQQEQYVELLILIQGFIKNGKAEQWCIDHYKEGLQKAIEPLQD